MRDSSILSGGTMKNVKLVVSFNVTEKTAKSEDFKKCVEEVKKDIEAGNLMDGFAKDMDFEVLGGKATFIMT